MPEQLNLTLVVRPPEASKVAAEQLLSGTYDPSQTSAADLAADPSDVKAVTDFASTQGLQVVSVEPEKRTVHVSGSAEEIQKAFGIKSETTQSGSVQSLDYKGPVQLPGPLNGIVIAVLGLDQTPVAKHHAV